MSLKVSVKATNPTAATARINKRFTAVKKTVGPLVMSKLRAIQATAMDIVYNEAYDSGNLYRNIKVYPSRLKDLNRNLEGRVGPDMRQVPYSEFVEGGHWAGFPNRPKVWVNGIYFMERAVMRHYRSTRSNIKAGIINAFRYYDKGMTHRTTPEMQISPSKHGVKAVKQAARQRFWDRNTKETKRKIARLKKAGKNTSKISFKDRRAKRTKVRRTPRRIHYKSLR